jgi:2'-5' RNA ligase
MPTQLLLPGVEPKPELTDRILFVALPDSEAIAQIAHLSQSLNAEYRLRGRPIIGGRLHVSLFGLGDWPAIPQRLITAASHAAARVTLDGFDATFDRVLSFSRGARGLPLVIVGREGTDGLTMLQRVLISELQNIGLPVAPPKHFTPHLTLRYTNRNVVETYIEPITWRVRDFVLAHSLIGKNQPYTALGRWPLGS